MSDRRVALSLARSLKVASFFLRAMKEGRKERIYFCKKTGEGEGRVPLGWKERERVFSLEFVARHLLLLADFPAGRRLIEGACLSEEGGSIFKATAIFDSYSPGLWFWRHLFPDPSSPPPPTPFPLSLSLSTHAHAKRKRDLSVAWYRLRSTGNCTMPADTPPISEHRLRSTPSLCSTLLRQTSPKSIATSEIPFRFPQIFLFS